MHVAEIRNALLDYIPRTLIRRRNIKLSEEFRICRGNSRADLAVFTRKAFYGLEIKSAKDRVIRLESQVQNYNEVFDYNYVVVTTTHLREIENIIPDWWGIVLASQSGQVVRLRTIRRSNKNPSVNPLELARLFWRNEAVEILKNHMKPRDLEKMNRQSLWQLLSDTIAPQEMRAEFFRNFITHGGQISNRKSMLYDDLQRL